MLYQENSLICYSLLQDDLLNELEELEQEELDAKMLETPSPVVSAPNVPNHMPGKSLHSVEV